MSGAGDAAAGRASRGAERSLEPPWAELEPPPARQPPQGRAAAPRPLGRAGSGSSRPGGVVLRPRPWRWARWAGTRRSGRSRGGLGVRVGASAAGSAPQGSQRGLPGLPAPVLPARPQRPRRAALPRGVQTPGAGAPRCPGCSPGASRGPRQPGWHREPRKLLQPPPSPMGEHLGRSIRLGSDGRGRWRHPGLCLGTSRPLLLQALDSGGFLAAVKRGRPGCLWANCQGTGLGRRWPRRCGQGVTAASPREEALGGSRAARTSAAPRGGAGTQECAPGELVRQRVWCLPSWPWFRSDTRGDAWQPRSSPPGTLPPLRFARLRALLSVGPLPQFPHLRGARCSPAGITRLVSRGGGASGLVAGAGQGASLWVINPDPAHQDHSSAPQEQGDLSCPRCCTLSQPLTVLGTLWVS